MARISKFSFVCAHRRAFGKLLYDILVIALFQMQSGSEISENLIKSIEAIREAAENGADLILFPEVHLTEFFRNIRDPMQEDTPSVLTAILYGSFAPFPGNTG